MRILVISDTHKQLGHVIDILSGDHRFDRIFHLGDLVHDAEDIEAFSGVIVDKVAGNCDWGGDGAPSSKEVEIRGKKFFLCHGHQQHVKYGDSVLRQMALEGDYDGIFYGHTHHATYDYEGDCLIMNPGSISLPRDGEPSYGVIHIDDNGVIHTNIVRI